jgi:hypothetical protein
MAGLLPYSRSETGDGRSVHSNKSIQALQAWEGVLTMIGELVRIGSVFAFTISLLRLREVFLSVQVGERRTSNEKLFKQ